MRQEAFRSVSEYALAGLGAYISMYILGPLLLLIQPVLYSSVIGFSLSFVAVIVITGATACHVLGFLSLSFQEQIQRVRREPKTFVFRYFFGGLFALLGGLCFMLSGARELFGTFYLPMEIIAIGWAAQNGLRMPVQ